MAEVGRHVDIIGNDYNGLKQLILFRFVLVESGIEVVTTSEDIPTLASHQKFAQTIMKKEFYTPQNQGLVLVESDPEDWLLLLSDNLDGDYILATAMHGPGCLYGDVGDSIPMKQVEPEINP